MGTKSLLGQRHPSGVPGMDSALCRRPPFFDPSLWRGEKGGMGVRVKLGESSSYYQYTFLIDDNYLVLYHILGILTKIIIMLKDRTYNAQNLLSNSGAHKNKNIYRNAKPTTFLGSSM